ncbi:ribbon-helix-helix domain-containing protein [Indioceanicola profundi]|uniref:ribbon-helix-helix domain-containing protein n=1 Tax=Indioceanicola profundi TaxID=2220096 RepID=UPI000E6AB859|nr:ribbon-helix-helix domain-containing protein [Indioceanicola profundi]
MNGSDNENEKKTEVYVPSPLEVDGQLISHNVWVEGHRTSVRLEAVMWKALNEISGRESLNVHQLITLIARRRHPNASLTATVRAFLVAYYRAIVMLRDEGKLTDENMSLIEILERAMFRA